MTSCNVVIMKRSTLFVVGCGTHYNSCHEVLEHQYKVEHLFDPKNAVISGERKFDIPIANFSEFQKTLQIVNHFLLQLAIIFCGQMFSIHWSKGLCTNSAGYA